MSDSIVKDTQALTERIVKDAKVQLERLKKVKAMTQLAKELGEPTDEMENLLNVSESVLKDLAGKLISKK